MAQDSDDQTTDGANGAYRDTIDEAERAGQLLGEWGSRVGQGIAAAAARVREGVEDIWAEAQSIRKGEHE